MSQRVPEIVDRPHFVGWTFPRSDLAVHECLQELRLPPYEHFGEISFVEVIRQYMYWFIGAGTLMILMLLVTLYVTALNRALAAEIIERKRAEAALRVSVERFEHIASCSADWIWESDAASCFTYSSSIVEQMLGYRADEIIGKSHFELFSTAEKERLTTLGQKGLGTGARIFRERFRLLTKDGRVVIQETTAEPIIDSSGQFAGYRGVNRDITNQVRFVRLRQ
jgi:PAS domain S-box-containing protein